MKVVSAAALMVGSNAIAQQPNPITPQNCQPGQPRHADAVARVRQRAPLATRLSDLERVNEMIRVCRITQAEHRIDLVAVELEITNIGQRTEISRLRERISQNVVRGTFSHGDPDLGRYMSLNNDSDAAAAWVRSMREQSDAVRDRERRACTPQVNLGDRFGPSRHQGQIGWCFGFAAADLLSFKTGRMISAADVSLAYFNSTPHYTDGSLGRIWAGTSESDISGGFPNEAMSASLQRGLCLERNFRSDDNGPGRLRSALEDIERIRNSRLPELRIPCEDDLRKVNRLFPTIGMLDLSAAMVTSVNTSFISRLAESACQPRIRATNLAPRMVEDRDLNSSKVGLFGAIDRQLSSGNPVSIGMNATILRNPDSRAQDTNHSVLLIGRRFNESSRSCEYLVRNSYGPDCGLFSSRWTCDDDRKGHAWVSKEALKRSTRAAYWLD